MSPSQSSSSGPNFRYPENFTRSGERRWHCNICTSTRRSHFKSMTAAAAKAHERSKQHILKADKQEPWEWEPANNCQFDLSAWEPQSRTFADLRVNLINDYVPFWRDGVEAAEAGGKPTSMEIFLSRFDDDPWGWNNDSGDKASDGWSKPLSRANAADDWGSPAQEKNEWGDKGVQDKSGWGAGAVAGGGNTEEDPQNHSGWAGGEAGWDVPALVPDASRPNEDQNDRSSGRKKSGGGRVRKRKYNWTDVPDRDAWTFVEKYAREEDASPERRQQMHQFFEMPTHLKVQKIEEMIHLLRTAA
ncbi:hypothetical protein BKA93DRAFT_407646 [Sparassis latifolia]